MPSRRILPPPRAALRRRSRRHQHLQWRRTRLCPAAPAGARWAEGGAGGADRRAAEPGAGGQQFQPAGRGRERPSGRRRGALRGRRRPRRRARGDRPAAGHPMTLVSPRRGRIQYTRTQHQDRPWLQQLLRASTATPAVFELEFPLELVAFGVSLTSLFPPND